VGSQNFSGTRNRFEVGATRLDEVCTAQVSDTELVQVILREIDHLRQLLLIRRCRLARQRILHHGICQLPALGGLRVSNLLPL